MVAIRRVTIRCALALTLVLSSPLAVMGEQTLSIGDKAALQAVMQHHIERQLVDGAFLQMDFVTGQVRRLHPGSAHPMILHLGEYFVLCADFKDDDGRSVNIDFYIARKGNMHVVFQTVVDNRMPLMKLINRGKATVAN